MTCLLILSPNVVLGETVIWGDLVERKGVFYKKFTNIPFSGKVKGQFNGEVRNGKKNSVWESYHDNGQLAFKGHYKDGNLDGLWETYRENGQLWIKGHFLDGKREGLLEEYDSNGTLMIRETYKDGKKVSD